MPVGVVVVFVDPPYESLLTGNKRFGSMTRRAEVAQVVEHGTENAGVDSSSLSLGTTYFFSPDSTTINPKYLRRACYFAGELPTLIVSHQQPEARHWVLGIQSKVT